MAMLPDMSQGAPPPALGTPGDPYFTGEGETGLDLVSLRRNAPQLFEPPPVPHPQAPSAPAMSYGGPMPTLGGSTSSTMPIGWILGGAVALVALYLLTKR